MALLGEMTRLEGRLIMSKDPSKVDQFGLQHSISYAAQSPWLRHQSIKDNILFGYPLDEERYQAIVECCALQPDLDMLEDGDTTEIGARYVSIPFWCDLDLIAFIPQRRESVWRPESKVCFGFSELYIV